METTTKLRRTMKSALDVLSIAGTNPQARRAAVTKLGMTQNPLTCHFEARLASRRILRSSLLCTRRSLITDGGNRCVAKIAAIDYLSKNRVIRSLDFVKKLSSDSNPDVATAAKKSVAGMEGYLRVVELWGTLFRG